MSGHVLRVAGATVVLVVLQAVAGSVLMPAVPEVPGVLPWAVVSAAMTAAVLVAIARHQAAGTTRALRLFAIWWGIQATALSEAILFPIDLPAGLGRALFAHAFVVALVFGFVVDRIAGRPAATATSQPRHGGVRLWAAVGASTAAYVVAYFSAGTLVWPFVAAFYSARAMPPAGAVLLAQVARGLALTGVVALVALRSSGSRRTIALLSGLVLSVVGGIAPLLVPNPYMPSEIRLPHMVEVGVSNLLFGVVSALLLTRATAAVSAGNATGVANPVS